MSTRKLLLDSLLIALPLTVLTVSTSCQAVDVFTIDRYVIQGGGVDRARSACFELAGTIAQPVPGYSSSAPYSISAGFWVSTPTANLDQLFFDGLEDCTP